MYPIISYDLAQARLAELHGQAQQDALARAICRARPARRQRSQQPAHRVPVLAPRHMLAVLGARSH
jgi:hypothetical protein